MLRLPEAWVWDFWLVDDGQRYHLFFLYASRAVGDPDARHHRASVGHAVSDDLTTWRRVSDALVRGDAPAFDETATWTGSVVRHPDGRWFMFYTGAQALGATANVQTVGYATSIDLTTWTKSPDNPVLSADSRWYEKLVDGVWHDEAFRDPWVLPDPSGQGWHMLITARTNHGETFDRGVVGHATSDDLERWTLQAPLSDPGQGFAQLEVMQYVEIEGRRLLLFSCLAKDTSSELRATGTTGGVWVADADGPLGPYDLRRAHQVTDSSQYVGRLIQDRETGEWLLLTFANDHHDGSFVGELLDPVVFHPPAPAEGTTWSTSTPRWRATRRGRATTRGASRAVRGEGGPSEVVPQAVRLQGLPCRREPPLGEDAQPDDHRRQGHQVVMEPVPLSVPDRESGA